MTILLSCKGEACEEVQRFDDGRRVLVGRGDLHYHCERTDQFVRLFILYLSRRLDLLARLFLRKWQQL